MRTLAKGFILMTTSTQERENASRTLTKIFIWMTIFFICHLSNIAYKVDSALNKHAPWPNNILSKSCEH